jgi:phosphoglycerate dehydrogenase-like enzyme
MTAKRAPWSGGCVVRSAEDPKLVPADGNNRPSVNSTAPVHVLCTGPFNEAQIDRLRAVSPRLVLQHRRVKSRAELIKVLSPDVEVLFSSFAPETLEPLPRLRWFQGRSAGVNAFIGTPLWHSDVRFTTASGVHSIPIAEYITGMMIALARDFLGYLDFQRRACWPRTPKVHYEQFPGRELRGATVVIIGYGSIGRETARQSHALGLRVLAIKRDPAARADPGFIIPGTGDPDGSIPEKILSPADLDEALPLAEYVVIASASTAETRHLMGEAQLRRMRRDAILINIARGDIVDESALVRALQERWIAGAGLDVFEREPLPADHPLWRLDNVILSPHIAGFTPRYDDHMAALFAENLRRYLSGEPLLNLVDRSRGY